MEMCKIVIEPTIPEVIEQPTIVFNTTGLKGGNAHHGGIATLSFLNGDWDGLAIQCIKSGEFQINQDELNTINVSVFGDWEICGMIEGLIRLGRRLEKVYPHAVTDNPNDKIES